MTKTKNKNKDVGVERALDLEVGELGSGLSILAMSQSLSFFVCKMKIKF